MSLDNGSSDAVDELEDNGSRRHYMGWAGEKLQYAEVNVRRRCDGCFHRINIDLRRLSSDLRDWLNVPDATIDHNAACAKKHPGTGTWLVKSPQFSRWLTEENSIMWLNGFAGSGKSVLCSTAIQFALRHRRSDPNVGIAFFYFTFNDESKQDVSAMLRALSEQSIRWNEAWKCTICPYMLEQNVLLC